MDFENEIEKIFTYLNPEKVKELANSTNSGVFMILSCPLYDKYRIIFLFMLLLNSN